MVLEYLLYIVCAFVGYLAYRVAWTFFARKYQDGINIIKANGNYFRTVGFMRCQWLLFLVAVE